MMYDLLGQCGETWDRKQFVKAVRHEVAKQSGGSEPPRKYRIIEAGQGNLIRFFFADLADRMMNLEMWHAVEIKHRTMALQTLAFRLISRSMGRGYEDLSRMTDYPSKLVAKASISTQLEAGLSREEIEIGIQNIVDECKCGRRGDQFTKYFLKQFPTIKDICSDAAQHDLLALAAVLQNIDIGLLENWNSRIQGLQRFLSSTHNPSFADVSAEWMAQQCRAHERERAWRENRGCTLRGSFGGNVRGASQFHSRPKQAAASFKKSDSFRDRQQKRRRREKGVKSENQVSLTL